MLKVCPDPSFISGPNPESLHIVLWQDAVHVHGIPVRGVCYGCGERTTIAGNYWVTGPLTIVEDEW